jgi:hypothetical protein
MTEYTAREKMRAAQREVNYRRYVYPNRIAAGKMTQNAANEQIEIMQAIAYDYGKLAEAEEAKARLL